MHNKPYRFGDHYLTCDICGAQRYASQCRKTWDGYWACLPNNCWYPKHGGDVPTPVINDPQPLIDVRPPVNINSLPMVSQGALSKWNFIINSRAIGGRIQWNNYHKKWGRVDEPNDMFDIS